MSVLDSKYPMNKRVDNCLANGLTGVHGNFLAAGTAFFKLADDGCISLNEGDGLLDQPSFNNLASVV